MFENIHSNKVYRNLFNGSWVECATKQTSDILSPVDGSLVGKTQLLSREEIDLIVQNSRESQKVWQDTPVSERARILERAADILEEHTELLAGILEAEIAKDTDSAISEVKRTADFIRFTANEGMHMQGEAIGAEHFPGFKKNKISYVTRVPLGIVLAISPFNYPINLTASKVAPALIAGNSVILKPPTQGSISALYLAEAFHQAGLPAGVLNTVTGKGSEIGDYLITHKDISFINFTGSTKVGKHIAQIAGMVPMLLELGGKDAAIVLEDADLTVAAKNIVSGAYSYSGQRCTAVKRILVVDQVADELVGLIESEVRHLKVGNPGKGVQITPLINKEAADFVEELIRDALAKGAKLITGNLREGNLIYPTLMDYVTTDMRLAWEEPFGPVLPILRVKDIEEAIDIANRSEYGLQSSVFTRNIDLAFQVAEQLEVGTVQINNKPERGPDHFPFLGVKSSGMGTQGIHYSIEAMSRPKAIVVNLNQS
jgi:glyceraldehyde-3-phosphate dehydrogenase (NADP+)